MVKPWRVSEGCLTESEMATFVKATCEILENCLYFQGFCFHSSKAGLGLARWPPESFFSLYITLCGSRGLTEDLLTMRLLTFAVVKDADCVEKRRLVVAGARKKEE